MPLPAGARDACAPWLRLVLTPGIGPAAVRRLLETFGLPEDVLAAGHAKLSAALGPPRAPLEVAAVAVDEGAQFVRSDLELFRGGGQGGAGGAELGGVVEETELVGHEGRHGAPWGLNRPALGESARVWSTPW